MTDLRDPVGAFSLPDSHMHAYARLTFALTWHGRHRTAHITSLRARR